MIGVVSGSFVGFHVDAELIDACAKGVLAVLLVVGAKQRGRKSHPTTTRTVPIDFYQ